MNCDKDNPVKSAVIGVALVAVATVIFDAETVQSWIEAVWRQFVGGETGQ